MVGAECVSQLCVAENVTVCFVFVSLNKASTSELFLVSDTSVKRYSMFCSFMCYLKTAE